MARRVHKFSVRSDYDIVHSSTSSSKSLLTPKKQNSDGPNAKPKASERLKTNGWFQNMIIKQIK